MRHNQIFFAIGLLCISFQSYGLSPQDRSAAVYGCMLPILDGMAANNAKQQGRDPSSVSLDEKKKFVEWFKNTHPGEYAGIENACGCTIDVIYEEEGTIHFVNAEEVIKKHMLRIGHECYNSASNTNQKAGIDKDKRIEQVESGERVRTSPKKSGSLKLKKYYREDSDNE